jgi:DNA-binding NtrC family response regulator
MSTVLIIDDDSDIRDLYSTVLAGEGYQVMVAENCAEADSSLKNQKIDLVILDIQLGQESGLNMLQQIIKDHAYLPVILCSAYNYYKNDVSSWQANAYIVKSSDLTELKEGTERLLNHNLPESNFLT